MPSANSPSKSGPFNLSSWAIAQQPLMIFLMLATLVAGAMSYTKLTRNEDPPFTIKTMVVAAKWPGATVADTINLVTDKIEQKLEETPHLDRLESYTRDGEVVVFVNLKDDTPPAKVQDIWYQVRKKVTDIAPTLPSGVQGPLFDDEFGDTFGVIYGFIADGFSPREVRDHVDAIRAAILKTPDIGKAQLLGVQEEQIVLEFQPGKLAAFGLDIQKVAEAIQAQNAVTPSGVLRLKDDKVSVRVSGAFQSEESLRDFVIRTGAINMPLSDLAIVSRIPADPPAPLFRVNGGPAIGLAISMAPTGNLIEFGAAVRARMSAIAATLPHGIEVTQVADQSVIVDNAIFGFLKVLIEAISIVMAVSFISLGVRAGLVVAASVPLVLAMTFVGMDLAGIGLQRISLGALIIALGLLVDDAMITVEAMVGKLEERWDIHRAASYAYESTAFPMLTGTLVMIAGFIPVGFAASSAGEYCYSLFMVVLISLSASWIVAILFSPLLGIWLLPKTMAGHAHGEGRVMRAYGKALHWTLHNKRTVILSSLAALALSVFGATKLEEQFFPSSDRSELLVNLTLPQNASLSATTLAAEKLEMLLKKEEGVASFWSNVGSGAIRFYLPMDVLLANDNVAQFVVMAKGIAERDALKLKLEHAFRTEFDNVVGRATSLELGPPVGWPLKYRVTGPDLIKVREIALKVSSAVAANSYARDVNLSAGEPRRRVQVVVRQDDARALGLSSEQIAQFLATTYTGALLTVVRDGNRMLEVKVRAETDERNDVTSIANLQIPIGGGRTATIGQFADVTYGVEDPIVWRRQREPIITVQADVDPMVQPATVAAELKVGLDALRAQLPLGYSIAEGGVAEESSKGNESVFAVVPAMLLVMVTLLMVQLRDFSRVTIALFMAPLGLVGVVAAMLPTGTPMGFVAQLGVIALAGMIIRNAVILIEEVDHHHAAGLSPKRAVVAAAKHRARPILLTACAAILGMIPIAPQIFWGPMALAIIGGLTAATLFTLTLLPTVLLMLLNWEAERATSASSSGAGSDSNDIVTANSDLFGKG